MPLVALLFATASAALAAFPCNVQKLPRVPILLVGENHCSDPSHEVADDVHRRVARGEVAGAFEGLYAEEEARFKRQLGAGADAQIFGIEEQFSHGLIFSYFAGRAETVCEMTDDEAALGAVKLMRKNRFLQRAWAQVYREIGGDGFARTSRAATAIDEGARGFPMDRARFQALSPDDYAEMLAIFRMVNQVYVQMANQRLHLMGLTSPLVSVPLDGDPDGDKAADASIDAVIIPVRDREMSINLEAAYCASAAAGRGLIAIVGANHQDGMIAYLSEESNGLVVPERLRSDIRPSAALARIAAVAAARRRAETRIPTFAANLLSEPRFQ